jgi:hypothetical protein
MIICFLIFFTPDSDWISILGAAAAGKSCIWTAKSGIIALIKKISKHENNTT